MSTEQLTLLQVIQRIATEPKDKMVKHGFGRGQSYRGYYDQLAFCPVDNTTVGAMLEAAQSCLNKFMTGYKGGEFHMHEDVRCNIAEYGDCGEDDELTMERLNEMLGIIPHQKLAASHARLVKALESQKKWLAGMGYARREAIVDKALAEAKALTGEAG